MNPSRKVGGGFIGGSLTAIGVWVAKDFYGVIIPGEIAAEMAVVVGFIFSWIIPEPKAG